MPSAHETSMISVATRRMSEKPQLAAVIAVYCRGLNNREYDQNYVDAVFQKPWGDYDLYEAWGFAQVHNLLCSGTVVTARIWVGNGPAADREIAENGRRLAKLPNGFVATFGGGLADQDGHLQWTKDIELGQRLPDGSVVKHCVGPRTIPLEVGYTKVSRTLLHLSTAGAVARWPYGQEWIMIFVNRSRFGRVEGQRQVGATVNGNG